MGLKYRVSHPIVREISTCCVLGVPLPFLGSSYVAAVAAHKPGKLPKWIATEYRNQGDGSPCISVTRLSCDCI